MNHHEIPMHGPIHHILDGACLLSCIHASGVEILDKMSEIGGPRCCKRNAYISMLTVIEFIFNHQEYTHFYK